MLKTRIGTVWYIVLVGLALALPSPAPATADGGKAAEMTASRRPTVPTSAPPLVLAESDRTDPAIETAVPVSETTSGDAPIPDLVLPATPEPRPAAEPDAGPMVRRDAVPPQFGSSDHGVREPSGFLPMTGGVTALMAAGALLTLGGLSVAAGRPRRNSG